MQLTQAIVAEHLDLTQQAVSELLARLRFNLEGGDLDRLRIEYIRSLRHAAAGRGGDEMAGERLRLITAKRRRTELELARRAGNLCEVEPVRRAVTNLAAAARLAFERIPDKLADRLAAATSADDCSALLTAEIDAVLADLAAGARAMRFET